MRLIISGGGTGGHIYPALAIIQGMKEKYPDLEVLYIGTEVGLEAKIVPKQGVPFKKIEVRGLPRKLSPKIFSFFGTFAKSLNETRRVLKEFKPDMVIGTGGYVSGPVVLMACLQGIPTLIHEQNALPGITNKFLSPYVSGVALTFPEAQKRLSSKTNLRVTGLPIRKEMLTTQPQGAWQRLGFNPELPLVLITGGSRGARSINLALGRFYEEVQEKGELQVLHVTGEATYEETVQAYLDKGIKIRDNGKIRMTPYLHNMADALAIAKLVVCRAGATTLAEITACGVPSILVPYPYAAENHQEYNALALVNEGAAIMVKDENLKGDLLSTEILGAMKNKAQLAEMAFKAKSLGKPEALEQIINFVEELLDN